MSESTAAEPEGVQVNRSLSAGSQCLFNIYYLGHTRVDRRCNSSMMPWIIEELKLKAGEMKFIWLSPGPEGVSFVADNGQELFKHSYGNILHCCTAVDGISFAYTARQEKDRYFCHVFQALTYEEAAKIMMEFKEHAQEEVTVPPTITHNLGSTMDSSSADIKSSGYIMSTSSQSSGLSQEEEYKLEYWGKYEIPSLDSANYDQVAIIDTLVSKCREAMPKHRTKKRSFGSKFMGRSMSKPPLGHGGLDAVDSSASLSAASISSVESEEDSMTTSSVSLAQKSVAYSINGSDSSDVSLTLTPSSPPPPEVRQSSSTSPDDPADHHVSCTQALRSAGSSASLHSQLRQRTESTDFDTLPELANLKSSTEFQALSMSVSGSGTGVATVQSQQKVRLLFSGVSVVVAVEQTQHIILKKSIRNIACCAQGKKESDFVGFTSRNKEHKKHFCYLFMAKNAKMAIKVLESFKSAFVHTLSMTLPPAVCEYCPYNQIQQLCKNLEGVSTQVAQTILQECLSTINESDYNQIMLSYKKSEHADHEYTQIIVLVALLREHFQKKQEKHTHRGVLPSKSSTSTNRRSTHPNTTLDSSSKLVVPALTRAKMAIANSFENLRSKPGNDKKHKTSRDTIQEGEQETVDRKSESLNLRSTSPLFSRKTNLATLMAPVATSPAKESLTRARGRSWTADMSSAPIPIRSSSEGRTEEPEKVEEAEKPEEKKPNDLMKTPKHISLPKRRSFQREHRAKYSLTPPSVSTVDKYLSRGHRRSSSNVVSRSWRQEIFDSVSTPTKLEGRLHSPETDILDEWQVIEISSQNGGSWKVPKETEQDAKDSPPTRARKRWKNAINQQLLLNRMEKENQQLKMEGRRKLKLYHTSLRPESSESLAVWRKLLEDGEDHSSKEIHDALLLGVPPSCREEVWEFLSGLFQARHKPEWEFPAELLGEGAFNELSHQTTEYEHSINVDLGRTFPSHPYFSSNLQEGGQSELHRILHGYAVADPETGYCQGLSFVTGLILMHTNDDQSAFKILYKLMNLHGYKQVYRGSLSNLQVRLYQLSRLMHDFIPALHQLLQLNDVTPFYYAAPWFLTIFASQFPISFTARVFDLIFYEGPQVLFKVALAMLKVHEAAILKCDNMESICVYLKTRLPEEVFMHEDTILKQALQFDFEGKLELFETEYQVMDELNARFSIDMPVDMESLTATLRRNNLALVEQLAICFGSIISLQQQVETLQKEVLTQQEIIVRLDSDHSRTSDLNDL